MVLLASVSEAIKYLKRVDTFPFVFIGRMQSYELHGTFIPGGTFIEHIQSRKDAKNLCDFLNKARKGEYRELEIEE